MRLTKKQQTTLRRAAWRQALHDGRVLRDSLAGTLTSYPTIEARDRALATAPDLLTVVQVPHDQQ